MVPEKKSKATPVYVRSDENCWVPALQLKTYNGKATVSVPVFKTEQNMLGCGKASRKQRYNENQIVELKHYPGGALPLQNVDSNGSLQDFKDMVDLPFMHEVSRLSPRWCYTPIQPTKTRWLTPFCFRQLFFTI